MSIIALVANDDEFLLFWPHAIRVQFGPTAVVGHEHGIGTRGVIGNFVPHFRFVSGAVMDAGPFVIFVSDALKNDENILWKLGLTV